MNDHAIVARVDGQVRCRCGEVFATDSAHEAHWALAKAAEVAPAGIAEARRALRGDQGAVEWGTGGEWGTSSRDDLILRVLVGVVVSLLVVLAAMGPETPPETSPDPMTYTEEAP
jgi:hypothetical protein